MTELGTTQESACTIRPETARNDAAQGEVDKTAVQKLPGDVTLQNGAPHGAKPTKEGERDAGDVTNKTSSRMTLR